MYVQLLVRKHIEVHGRPTQFHPGDWVDVGKQDAQLWIARGEARQVSGSLSAFPPMSGVVIRGDDGRHQIECFSDDLSATYTANVELCYHNTLLWDASALRNLRTSLLPIGFSLLQRWQVAAPLLEYQILAQSIGSEKDREITRAVIRDLRVPVYDTRMLFVRRCVDTEKLIADWNVERQRGDERLAFLRALYSNAPFILPLPHTWTKAHGD